MESKQKSTEAKRRVRKVILSGDFYAKLEQEHPVIMQLIMHNLERMNNDIIGSTSLAFTFNEERERPRFVIFNFIELDDENVKLYEYEDITSDQYLDMLLAGEVLKSNNYTYTQHDY